MHDDTQDLITLEEYAPIMDVDLDIYAELDGRTISFRELVGLDVDALLPLCRPSGENIDVYVGEVPLGSGEILVIDGNLAIRIADLRDKPPPLESAQATTEAQPSA